MLNAYPIFKKDFRQLMIFLVGALAVETVIVWLWFHHSNYPYYSGFPHFQAIYCVVIVMTFAGYWWAEERAGGNDQFLLRLPVDIRRIYDEKILSVLAAYCILLATQFLLLLSLENGTGGILGGRSLSEILALWLSCAVSAYMIGLVLSRWMNHALYVVAYGCVIHFAGWGLIAMVRRQGLESLFNSMSTSFLTLFIVICGMCIAIWYSTTNTRASQICFPLDRYRRQCAAFSMISLAMLSIMIVAKVFIESSDIKDMAIGVCASVACILTVLLGTTIYDPAEKQGTLHLLYHHPISRSTVYWTRVAWSLPVLFLNWLIILGSFDNAQPRITSTILAASLVFAVLPFFASLVATHAFRRPLFATLAVIAGATLTFAVLNLHFSKIDAITRAIAKNSLLREMRAERFDIATTPEVLLVTILLAVGFSLSGWRCATDRTLLAGSDFNRVVYVCRLLLFVVALTLLIFCTGYRDLLFLITGVDLGIG